MAAVTPRKRELEVYNEGPIIVEVGGQSEKFYIHRDVLTKTSKYFDSYLSGRWTVGDTVKPPDPDIEVHTFRVYTHWLYTNVIDFSEIDLRTPESLSWEEHELEELTKLYILSDALDDKSSRNAAMRKIFDLLNQQRHFVPTDKTFILAYGKTNENSNLCQILLDESLHRIYTHWLKERYEHLPLPFTKKLTIQLYEYACDSLGDITDLACQRDKYLESDGEGDTESEMPVRAKKVKIARRKKKAVTIYEDE